MLVGVTHRFFEFALLGLLSNVFFEDSLPGATNSSFYLQLWRKDVITYNLIICFIHEFVP